MIDCLVAHRRHRALEFRKFLDAIESEVPAELDAHRIADDHANHKTALARNCLEALLYSLFPERERPSVTVLPRPNQL